MADESSYIEQLAEKWTEQADELTDDETRLECLALIADWLAMRQALSALSASADVTSYSIAGRTVTRASMHTVRRDADALADEIRAMLGTGGEPPVADLRRSRLP